MKEAFNKAINKIMGIKKHYYVIFALLIIFSAYNTITLRGFFYAENAPLTFLGFMDRYNGYTNAVSRSFSEADSGKGLVPSPENIHDVENAREWYGSILGTIVFMKWKWVGLHLGNHIILFDTGVPNVFCGDNHIFGHPYYILSRFDDIDNYPTDDERSDTIIKKMEKRYGDISKWPNRDLDKAKKWLDNVRIYRIANILFYIMPLAGIITLVLTLVKRRICRHSVEDCPHINTTSHS